MKTGAPCILIAVALIALPGIGCAKRDSAAERMRADVSRLVEAAKKRNTLWPWQEAEPEVALVAARGRAIAPMLVALLVDDPDSAAGVDWNVQQQVALALCKIYEVPEVSGHVYMNRATVETNSRVKPFWVSKVTEA